jgi:hypothetical protein
VGAEMNARKYQNLSMVDKANKKGFNIVEAFISILAY